MKMLSHMLAIIVVVGVGVMLPVGECGDTVVGGCKVTSGATVSWHTSVPLCLAASKDGDVVTVNSKSFYTQEAWLITKNITLQGSGISKIFSKYPGKTRSEIFFTASLTDDGQTSKDFKWLKITAKNVVLKDLYLNVQTPPASAGVDVSNVNLEIQNCEFVGRKDKLIIKEDPVDATSSSPYSLTITDSAFTNMQYGSNGGLMTMTLHRSPVTISGTKLSGGGGGSAGGCLYVKTSGTSPTSVSITSSTFDNCYAMEKTVSTGLEGGKGGGAYLDLQNSHPDSTFAISSSSFTNNKANGIGGGLYLENAPSALAAFSLDTITFSGNIAAMGGGMGISSTAMAPLQTDATKHLTFTDNSAHSHGGGVHISPALTTPRVYNCAWVFTNNAAGDFRVKLSLASNESKMRFGAITGEEKGGGIYVASSSSSTTDASMTTITFPSGTMTGNKASLGGAIAADSPVTINNIKTSANVAHYGGGALYFNSDAVVQQGCTLDSDSVTQSDHTTAPVIPHSGNGGAISIQSGKVELEGCSISDTSAYNDGGVLYIAGGKAVLCHTTMKGATAGGDGGCLSIHGGDVELKCESSIKQNSASNNGGGISMTSDSTSTLTIRDTTIVQNWALNGVGPAFYIHCSSPPSISVKESLVYGHSHKSSAAIVLYAIEGKSYTWTSFKMWYKENDGGHIEMLRDDDVDDTTGTSIALITQRDGYDDSPLDNDKYLIKISSVTADITFRGAFFDGGCVDIFYPKDVLPNVVADYYDAKDGKPAGVRYLKSGWYGASLILGLFEFRTCDERYLTHSSTHFPGTPEDKCVWTTRCHLPGDPADGEEAFTIHDGVDWPAYTGVPVATTTTTPPTTSSSTTTPAPIKDECGLSYENWWKFTTFLGWSGVTEASCLAKGYCWTDPTVYTGNDDKWKCHPQSVTGGYVKGSTCYVHPQDRMDAGWPGISAEACRGKWACWDSNHGGAWCYWPTNKEALGVYD